MKFYLAFAAAVHLGGSVLLLGYGSGQSEPPQGKQDRALWVTLPPVASTDPNLSALPPAQISTTLAQNSATALVESSSSPQVSNLEPTKVQPFKIQPVLEETTAMLPASFQWEYPTFARRGRGMEGRVVLEVEVADSGQVASVAILETSGHPFLDASAAEQITKTRLVPATLDGFPVSSIVRFAVEFRLF